MNPETQKANNISVVLKEVGKTIETVGIERTMAVLAHIRKNPVVLTEQQFQSAKNIIEIVCDEFKITVNELYSAQRKNNRRNAIGICAYLFEKYIKIDNANSAYILKKPDDCISTYKKEMTCLNEKHPVDKTIIEKIARIELKLKSQTNE